MITALLLDVDDTLIDTRAAMVSATQAAVGQLWPRAGANAHYAAGVHFHADPRGYFGRFTAGKMSFAKMRAARLADLIETFALGEVEEVSAAFEDAYGAAFAAHVRLFDDVRPLLAAAGAAGIPVGLLTNSSSAYTQLKLEITGLCGAFASVATRDSLGFGKPDPRAFLDVCRHLGVAPERALHAGSWPRPRPRPSTSVTTSRSTRSQPAARGFVQSGLHVSLSTPRMPSVLAQAAFPWWAP